MRSVTKYFQQKCTSPNVLIAQNILSLFLLYFFFRVGGILKKKTFYINGKWFSERSLSGVQW
jgi:hypothetical protein